MPQHFLFSREYWIRCHRTFEKIILFGIRNTVNVGAKIIQILKSFRTSSFITILIIHDTMNPIKLTHTLLICLATWSAHGETLPNMVFLMTDDQGWGDVGYNGHPKIKTPHLDDMAKTGTSTAFKPDPCVLHDGSLQLAGQHKRSCAMRSTSRRI